jgi:hypothetical protein
MNSSRLLGFSMILAFLTVAGGTAFFLGPQMLESYLVRERQLEKADAILVMAGSREERLPSVARLYHQGVAPKILLANDGVFAGEDIKIGVYPAVAEPDEEFSRIETLFRELIKCFYYRLRYGLV